MSQIIQSVQVRRTDDGSIEKGVCIEFTDEAAAEEKQAIREFGIDPGKPVDEQVTAALEWRDAIDAAETAADLKRIQRGRHPNEDRDVRRPNPGRGNGGQR